MINEQQAGVRINDKHEAQRRKWRCRWQQNRQ